MIDRHSLVRMIGAVIGPIKSLIELRALRVREFGFALCMAAVAVVFETAAASLIYPLLQYISYQGDMAALTAGSKGWQKLVVASAATGIPINQITLSGAVFVLVVIRQGVSYANAVYDITIKQAIEGRLIERCFKAIMASRASHLYSIGSGGAVELVFGQSAIAATLLRSYSNVFSLALTFLAYGFVMVATTPLVSLVALGIVGIVVVFAMRNMGQSRQLSTRRVKQLNDFSQFLTERFQNWKLIKLANAQEGEAELLQGWIRRIAGTQSVIARTTNRSLLIIAPCIVLMLLVTVYVSVNYLGITVATLTLFAIVLLRLLPAAQGLAKIRQSAISHIASLESVRSAIFAAESAREPDPGRLPFRELKNEIAFDDVSFTYATADQRALDRVTCRIPAGRITAVIGPSGAGKSTLVDLLPRLIEGSAGRITVDGIPISEFSLVELRRAIAYVPQQPILFDGTIAENIRYVRPNAPHEEVVEACRLARAEEFIDRMPEGYEARVGEGGHRLSGGQRQRIAIARAFLAEARIIVLDEPTSSLDMVSEQAIRGALENMVRRRSATVIVIAHRPSTVETAEHIVGLKNGRVIAEHDAGEIGEDRFIALMTGSETAGGAVLTQAVSFGRQAG